MNSDSPIHDQKVSAYSEKYLIIPVLGTFLIPLLIFYINLESFTLPGIIPWPDTGAGRVFAVIGIYFLMFLPLLLLCALMLAMTVVIPLFHPIFTQVRRDWSLVSFLLYGLSLFIVIFQDEYRGLGFYQLACFFVLGVGTFLYLLPAKSWFRYIRLTIVLELAMGILSLGIYHVYPQQSWAAITSFPRWWETIFPLLNGVSLALIMAVPALLNLIPPITDFLLISPE
jgi:hypothetical protein